MKKYVIVSAVAVVALYCGRDACASYLSSQYKNWNAYAAPCRISGTSTSVATQCSTWCKQQYPEWVDNTNLNFVTSMSCDQIGIYGDGYEFCCVNNSITFMLSNGDTGCRCPGTNRRTVSGTTAISRTVIDSVNSVYSFTCNDYKCFCDNGYYGVTKTLSQSSASDTCSKCPDMPSNNYGYNHATIPGQTFNNISSTDDDSKAPASSDITACNIMANCPMSPYCDRYDETGKWEFNSQCYYTK